MIVFLFDWKRQKNNARRIHCMFYFSFSSFLFWGFDKISAFNYFMKSIKMIDDQSKKKKKNFEFSYFGCWLFFCSFMFVSFFFFKPEWWEDLRPSIKITIIVVFVVVLITSIVLFAVSWSTLGKNP